MTSLPHFVSLNGFCDLGVYADCSFFRSTVNWDFFFFFFAAIVLDFCIGDKLVNLVYLVAFSIAEIGCVRNSFGYVPDLEGGLAFSIVVWF